MKQETFTDIEYSYRKKKTKREELLEIMDEIIPWEEWVGVIEPYYPKGKRGRPPMGIEKMLRMYLLQIWFNLSDPATEDAIYDSYAMRKFTGYGGNGAHDEGRHDCGCYHYQCPQLHQERRQSTRPGNAPDEKGQ